MSEVITFSAPEITGPKIPNDKFAREQRAFYRLLPSLLSTHRGEYVAIHEEQVVDSGKDLASLALRVYQQHGYVAIFMDLVTDEPTRIERIPSPHQSITGTS